MFKKRASKPIVALMIVIAMAVAQCFPTLAFAGTLEKGNLANGGKFYNDYNSLEEAQEAAAKIDVEISEEGSVLLKNDGTLPFSGKEYVSVFGVCEDGLTSGSGSVHQSLADAGFHVNGKLAAFYASNSNKVGNETTAFGKVVENSFTLYNDAAFVLFSRSGGEGSDLSRNTGEEATDEENVNGWEHVSPATDGEKNYKHYLQLYDSEIELLEYVKARFNKVVVVLNTSHIMEMYNLNEDPAINGIIWVGRTGANGITALGKIMNGTVNPSGHTVDEWYKDFTADPTWYNFGDNTQTKNTSATAGGSNTYRYSDGLLTGAEGSSMGGGNGLHGIDYEEGIYLGYKYYETVYAEIVAGNVQYTGGVLSAGAGTQEQADAWFADTVVYPFGYGLSYTTFDMSIEGIYTNAALTKEFNAATDAAKLASSAGHPAEIKKLYANVAVENTGAVAGKKVVEIYVSAPYYDGEIEKAAVQLVGYAKSDMLQPGQTQYVTVEFNAQDMAAFDYNDANTNGYSTWELDEGDYTIYAADDSHNYQDYYDFTIGADVIIALDDFSDNVVAPLFSDPTTEDYTIRTDEFFQTGMTILTRSDLVGTFPVAPQLSDLTFKAEKEDEFVNQVKYWQDYNANNQAVYADKVTDPWYITPEYFAEVAANWTQGEDTTGLRATLLKDMAGVALYVDGEINPLWTAFVNQLSWGELCELVTHGSYMTGPCASIGKVASGDKDGPNNLNSTYNWGDEVRISCTWNTELAHKQGIITADMAMFKSGVTGWYGPGANTHRTPFSGRNSEYYSQDGVQGGYMAAAVVSGAESRGLSCWIKHCLLNDQETNRNGNCCFTYTTEQAFRENILRHFQMAVQEGGSSAAMSAFARIGRVVVPNSYALLTELFRNQLGWQGIFVTDMYAGLGVSAFAGYVKVNAENQIVDAEGNVLKDAQGAPVVIDQATGKTAAGKTGVDQLTAEDKAKVVYIHDWVKTASGYQSPVDLMIRSGNDLPLGTVGQGTNYPSGTWDKTLRDGKGGVIVDTDTESYMQYYYVRMTATRILYEDANCMNNNNGISLTAFANATLDDATQAKSYTANIGIDADDSEVAYTATGLPEGLSINAKTGAITGTAKEVGTYKASVTVTADGWVTKTATFTITVNPGFVIDGTTTVEDGTAFDLYVEAAAGVSLAGTIDYAATGLPEGVTIDATTGAIAGTAAVGTYNVVVKVNSTVTSGSGTRQTKTTTTYEVPVTLTVTGEPAPVVTTKAIVNTEVTTSNGVTTYTITYDDGTTDVITVTDGKDGAQGIQGEKGETGAQGPKGDKGEDGTDGKDGKDGADGAGCSGAVGFGGLAALLMGACAVVALRKKED